MYLGGLKAEADGGHGPPYKERPMVSEHCRMIRFLVGCVVLVATGLACTAQGAGKQAVGDLFLH